MRRHVVNNLARRIPDMKLPELVIAKWLLTTIEPKLVPGKAKNFLKNHGAPDWTRTSAPQIRKLMPLAVPAPKVP